MFKKLVLLLGIGSSLAWGQEPSADALAEGLESLQLNINIVWTIIAAFLVFFMQAGFAMLETGLTRAKNAVNILMKNLMDFSIGSVAFFLVGFGLMFGVSNGWFGTTLFGLKGASGGDWNYTFLIFQTVFAATAATIVSGAVAERTKFTAYLIYSVAISAVIYPVFGSWAWGSLLDGNGWLENLSTGAFTEALQALLGPNASGLSATTITRLMSTWQQDYEGWNKRSLAGKKYVYVWADGVHFNIRLEEDRQCILVLMGATAEGSKELIAVVDGYRESEQSWRELLLSCKQRGLTVDPKLATGDGALGFWKALPQVYPSTRRQRCWVHKTANVLDKLPKRVQPGAKAALHEIWMAPSRADAQQAFDEFIEKFAAKYPKAATCLEKDREVLLTFYDFPAEHWIHVRTTNPIESTFATVRLRHRRTKGSGSRAACLAMVFKLMENASRRWRSLNGTALIPDVIAGIQFIDGERKNAA